MNPYEELSNAIVLQAVKDYRGALGILRFNPNDKDANISKEEIERFFHSGWFGFITNIDPETLVSRLRKEVT